MRHNAADFLAFLVLLARVDETAGRTARGLLELIVRIGGCEQPLARQRERHATGVDRDPSSAPLLGDIGRCAAAACWVDHEIPGIGCHEDAALNDSRSRLHNVEFVVAEAACTYSDPVVIDRAEGKFITVRLPG